MSGTVSLRSIDLCEIADRVGEALAPGVAMPDRAAVSRLQRELTGDLEALIAVEYGFDESVPAQALYGVATRILDLTQRPTADSSHYSAWQYVRSLATTTEAFADLYAIACEQPRDGV